MSKKRGLFGGKSYDTLLEPAKETAFRAWAGNKIADTADYDLRGAWLANAQASSNGHLPDTYKKPNHPTFSDQSIYSTPGRQGGTWAGNDGNWSFWASQSNMDQQSPLSLWDYFKKREPDATLILPSLGYSLPRGRR